MTPSEKLAESLFHQSADLAPHERAAFLDRACTGNAALRREVESLLASHDGGTVDFLQTRGAAGTSTVGDLFAAGDVIADRYKLLHELGEGGLGVVWLAEQKPPVRRKVAIKFIRLGMSSKEVLGRFEAERNALALMNHPNIARVLDAGAVASGQPFFVMEYVQGVSITQFCDRERLTTKERLELFTAVCAAVQHAHQKGVIHRDLKPSNILVTLHEGRPVAKIIDFGIAKATGQDLADRTLVTMPGQMIGTPEYMSPEQAEMSEIGVDSTTDIYSLGVVLYELLTSTLPFDSETLRQKGLHEMHRVIREVDAQKPSTRISTLGAATATVSARHRTDPRTLRSSLVGDLDWIVMKALEKERTRRYASASEFAADIQRHLRCEPVLACPPSQLYRFRKFARRNRLAVALIALTATALLVAIFGTTWAMLDARRQRDHARTAQADAERNGRREAAVGMLLLHGIGFAEPDAPAGQEFTVMQMLERVEQNILKLFPKRDQALERAASHTMLGMIYSLQDDRRGEAHLVAAIGLIEDESGEHPDMLPALTSLGHLRSLGTPLPGAEPIADPELRTVEGVTRRLIDIVARSFEGRDAEIVDSLRTLCALIYEGPQPARDEVIAAVRRLTAAAQGYQGTPIEQHRLAAALHAAGWQLRDRRGFKQESRPLFECLLELDADSSWSHQIQRMWSKWFLLLPVTGAEVTSAPADLAPMARSLRDDLRMFPGHNSQRFVMTLLVTAALDRAGHHDEAVLSAMDNWARLSALPRHAGGASHRTASWATISLDNIMDTFKGAGRRREAVDTIREFLEFTAPDVAGNFQAVAAWKVVSRAGWADLLQSGIYPLALQTASDGVRLGAVPIVQAQLAEATARLRIAVAHDDASQLRQAAQALEQIVATWRQEGEPTGWPWMHAQALAPLAMAQFHLGDVEAARATLELARSKDRPGAMFAEAEALIAAK